LVTHRIDNFQFHHLAGQQTKRPFAITRRRRAQPQGDNLCLLFAIEKLRRRRCLALLSIQCDLKPAFDKSLSHVFHRFRATIQGLVNLGIGPSWATRVCFEQNLSPLDLPTCALELSHDCTQCAALFLSQFNDLLL